MMQGLMGTVADKFRGDEGSARLYGLGLLASQLGAGQTPDASPALAMLDQRKAQKAFKNSMSDPGMMDMFTEQERAFLSTLPPSAAQSLIAQRVFAGPADPFAGTQVINGQLVGMGENGPQVLGDFNTPEPGYRTMTPEEVAGVPGLDPTKAYQMGPNNEIKAIGGGGVTVNNMPGGDEFAEAFAKGDAAALGTISESGMAAQRNITRIDQLASILENSPSGFAAAAALAAGEMGINTEGLSELQAAQAMINSLVPEQRQPGSGPMSDADLALFKQSLPRIINQPGGNQAIVGTMRAIAQYDAQGAQIVQRLRAGEIDRAQAFAELQSRPDPMAQFRQAMGTMPQDGGTPTPSATDGAADAGGIPTYNPQTGEWE